MTLVEAGQHLQANLACFGELNADVARAIASVEPASIDWTDTDDAGSPAMNYSGKALCSKRRPVEEGARLASTVDVAEHAVVLVLGFGAGYHVRAVAERMGKAGLIIVYEPDVALLRAVLERIDLSSWLRESLILWITDAEDRSALAQKLQHAESILAQGVHILAHPSSRDRLGERAGQVASLLGGHVAAAKTTLLTTLVRSVDTARNLILNLDHYAAGEGVESLRDIAKGCLGIVVSAGPSLQRNMGVLAEPGVRDRCLIVATQTTLKPLLKAGIRPHVVTALDYHEISKRFYEDIRASDVEDCVLIAEPKAHPIILDSYPGPKRCVCNPFLDQILGPLARPMGDIRPGATVAHLAMYVARWLGCDPVAFIGQDLGFTDGVYYTRGTAIDEVWNPELNPFNTIEMMEWQRIARHRHHLLKSKDVEGKTIYSDAQMRTYLQQFERDFAEDEARGLTVIDATEGGVPKQRTIRMTLRDTINQYGRKTVPRLPLPAPTPDPMRLERTRRRIDTVRTDIEVIRDASRSSHEILERMIEVQQDTREMDRLFTRLDQLRGKVERRAEAFGIINYINQLGVFRRFKADRRMHFAGSLSAIEQQRLQLERDRDNVIWIGDAAEEFLRQLDQADRVLVGLPAEPRGTAGSMIADHVDVEGVERVRAAAILPIDSRNNGIGHSASFDSEFGAKPVIQRTLERIGRSTTLERIILLASDDIDVEPLLNRSRINLPVEIHRCGRSPFGPEHAAIAAARLFADTSWRGGIAGMSVYDEPFCPGPTMEVMEKHGLNAAVIASPDWPLLEMSPTTGIDGMVNRHREHPKQLQLVFTQAPPGLSSCLVGRELLQEFQHRNRLCTIGAMLVYQPHAPQHDPIARDNNIQIDHQIRRSLIRATFDSPRYKLRLRRAIEPLFVDSGGDVETSRAVAAIEQQWLQLPTFTPTHVILELCTGRTACGSFRSARHDVVQRPPLSLKLAERILSQLGESRDTVLTLGGTGDPLRHPEFDQIIQMAKRHGVRAVHVRTELVQSRAVLDRLLAAPVDVVSVDLHADRAATYVAMMGFDRFRLVLENMDYLVKHRNRLTNHGPAAAFGLPWVVPRIQRRRETFEDLDSFFDRWVHTLGCAVIEGPPPWDADEFAPADTLMSTRAPARQFIREGLRRMTIYSNGAVPLSELDVYGDSTIGNVAGEPLLDLWRDLFQHRREILREQGDDAESLRTFGP